MTIVALDWDQQSARVAVTQRRPTGIVLLRAVSLDLEGDETSLADRLQNALPEVRWSKTPLVVALGEESITLRLLKLPPVPDNELPSMVRMLAEREFGGDDGAIDFVPLSGDATTQRSVLAVRVRQKTLKSIERLAEKLETTVARIVLRSCAAASLAVRLDGSLANGTALVVASTGAGADLVALAEGLPALIRTARNDHASDEQESSGDGLAIDIRRTLSAASLQLGRGVSRVAALGTQSGSSSAEVLPLVEQAQSKWRLPASDVEAMKVAAGVAGAALDEADKTKPAIDLLHPRQATIDRTPLRRKLTYAGVAAACVALVVGQAYWSLASLERETSNLNASIGVIDKSLEEDEPHLARAAAVENWLETDMNWLDELEQLSRQVRPQPLTAKDFPASDDVMLTQLLAGASSGRNTAGGTLRLDAVAPNANAPTALEQRLRGPGREVTQGSLDQSGQGSYRWRFKPSIKLKPSPQEVTNGKVAAEQGAPVPLEEATTDVTTEKSTEISTGGATS